MGWVRYGYWHMLLNFTAQIVANEYLKFEGNVPMSLKKIILNQVQLTC